MNQIDETSVAWVALFIAIAFIAVVAAFTLWAPCAHAQPICTCSGDPNVCAGVCKAPTITLTVPPTPSPTPTPAGACLTIFSPPAGPVSGVVPLPTSDTCAGRWFERLYVDGVPAGDFEVGQVQWNTVGAEVGPHVVVVVSQSKNAVGEVPPKPTKPTGAALVMLSVGVPTPSPSPSASPTPSAEIRPNNAVANHTVPSAAFMATFKAATAGGLGDCPTACEVPGAIWAQVAGTFQGTTLDILTFYALKWGVDPDLVKADAVQETAMHQNGIGDVGNGISLGILQAKSSDYPPTCPTVARTQNIADVSAPDCMSHLSTAFATDVRMADWGSCLQGKAAAYIATKGRDHAAASGLEPYPVAVANHDDQLMWGCMALWYSGSWQDSGSLAYQSDVRRYYVSKPWTRSDFLRTPVKGLRRPRR